MANLKVARRRRFSHAHPSSSPPLSSQDLSPGQPELDDFEPISSSSLPLTPSPSRPMANHGAPRKKPSVSRAPLSSPPALSPPSPPFPPLRPLSSSPSAPSSQDPSPPVPESNLKDYTKARLNQGISYAANVLARRNISPRSEEFLDYYKNEVSIALKAKTHKEKVESISAVRTLEVMIAKNYFLRPTNSLENQEADCALIELRELQYFHRYGDYIKILPNQIRQCASQNKLNGWEHISGRHQWSKVAEALAEEQILITKVARTGTWAPEEELDIPATTAVKAACRRLGLDEDLVRWSISAYAERNETVHRDLEWLKETVDFGQLAKVLYQDLRDIYCVFSKTRSKTDRDYLATIITMEIQKCFDTSVDEDDPIYWMTRKELVETSRMAREEKNRPSKIAVKAVNIKEAQRRSEEKASRNVAPPPLSKKRVASTERVAGREILR